MLYWLVWGFAKVIWFPLFRVRVKGRENVPATGGAILCCNHYYWGDPVTLATSVNRPVRFMAKEEIFKVPLLGNLVRGLGTFPVKRGTADRSSLKHALKVLEGGDIFGIFPEGTRSKTRQLLRPEPGVVWIAVRSRTPVIPMAIVGDYRFGGPITMRIGPAVNLADLYDQKLTTESMEEGAGRIQAAIAALLAG